MRGSLDGHRERDHGVDLDGAFGLVEAPAAAGLARDGTGDVPVEVTITGVAKFVAPSRLAAKQAASVRKPAPDSRCHGPDARSSPGV